LPPNQNPPEGEGWVTYSIRLKSSLPSGTEIRNRATIVFDFNDPIETNEVLNTLDIAAPISSVLSMTQPHSEQFNVSWFGSDGYGSGVSDFDIYVSRDGGPFEIWLWNTTNYSSTYIGEFGRTYAFYSVARDHVGNTESTALVPDLIVTPTPPIKSLAVTVSCDNASIHFGEKVTLDIYITCEGIGIEGATITLSCDNGGGYTSVTYEGAGHYQAMFSPTAGSAHRTDTLTVHVEKEGYTSNFTSAAISVNPSATPQTTDGLLLIVMIALLAAVAIAVVIIAIRRRK
jgi:hypothetical protein